MCTDLVCRVVNNQNNHQIYVHYDHNAAGVNHWQWIAKRDSVCTILCRHIAVYTRLAAMLSNSAVLQEIKDFCLHNGVFLTMKQEINQSFSFNIPSIQIRLIHQFDGCTYYTWYPMLV